MGSSGYDNFTFGILLAIFTFIAIGWMSVCNRRMKEVNFAVLQFNQAAVSSTITGVVMIMICINAKQLPFMYDSYWTYLEMIAAALANFFG